MVGSVEDDIFPADYCRDGSCMIDITFVSVAWCCLFDQGSCLFSQTDLLKVIYDC